MIVFSTFFLVVVILMNCDVSSVNIVENFAEDCYEEEYGRIIHSSAVFRHGDRNPYAPYPFDPYKNHIWAEGLGHLTNAGKQRLYDVGKWFKKRYDHLIGNKYCYQDIKMESSDYDRSLMSAECFLAGFYPPSVTEQWSNDGLKWQPVPVHSIPLPQDNIIAMFKVCDVYNYELFAANTAPRYKEMFKKNQAFFNYVGVNTGIMFNENFLVFGLLKLMEVYDSLNVQNQNNFTLPQWANAVFPEPMASLAVKIFDIGTYTEKMKRLKSGPFLKSVTMDMFKKAYEHIDQKLHFYSGHDSTIATIMITLGIFNNILPPYGSALIFELREKGEEHIVTVLYRNETNRPPHLMEIPECHCPCTLENFLDVTKPFITEDWDRECQVQLVIPQQMPVTNNWNVIQMDDWIFTKGQICILALVILFILASMFYFFIKRNIEHWKNELVVRIQTRIK